MAFRPWRAKPGEEFRLLSGEPNAIFSSTKAGDRGGHGVMVAREFVRLNERVQIPLLAPIYIE